MMERFSSLVTKSRPWPVIGRTIFFTSDKNRPTRDEIYFIDFWRENLSMYRINANSGLCNCEVCKDASWHNVFNFLTLNLCSVSGLCTVELINKVFDFKRCVSC